MPSLAEIVDRARQIGEGRGVDPFKNPIIDAGMTTEALVPHALRHAVAQAAVEDIADTRADHEIEVDADGVGALPATVLRKFLPESYLPELPRSARLPWTDFHRVRFDNLLCYYTDRNSVFKSSCDVDYGDLVRSIASVSKAADTDEIVADPTLGQPARGHLTVQDGTKARGWLTFLDPYIKATGSLEINQGIAATGTLTLTSNPANAETIAINGVTITFRTVVTAPSNEVAIGANATATAANLVAYLNASLNVLLSVATYAAGGPAPDVTGIAQVEGEFGEGEVTPPTVVTITYDTYGTAGNAYTLADSSGGAITRGAATLTGGVNGIVANETLVVNGATIQFVESVPPSVPGVIYVPFSQDATVTADTLATALNDSTNTLLSVATYTVGEDDDANVINIEFDSKGSIGNTFTLANSSGSGVTRSGTTLTGGLGGIREGETIVVNGVTFTFTNFIRGATQIPFSQSASYTATQAAIILNASVNASISVATYTYNSPDRPVPPNVAVLEIEYDAAGPGGNAFTLADSSYAGVQRSGATLLGGDGVGIAENETLAVNGITFTFKATPTLPAHIDFTGVPADDAILIAAALTAYGDPATLAASYVAIENVVYITYNTNGTAGNAFTLANSSANAVLRSETTLLGGVGDVGSGEFVALTDTGRRIVVTENGVETVNTLVQEVFTPDAVNVMTYREGSIATAVADGSAAVYETQLELIRTGISVLSVSPDTPYELTESGEFVATRLRLNANVGTGGGTDADVGRLMVITVAGEIVVRAMIVEVLSADYFLVAGYGGYSVIGGTASIYRILDPIITLNTPTLPAIPTDPDEDLAISPKIAENTVLTLVGALTGEIAVERLLGSERTEEK